MNAELKDSSSCLVFFFNDTATTEIYTLSLHDALPICSAFHPACFWFASCPPGKRVSDRKSTRLNSSHVAISYAVFCLKKKKKRRCLGCTLRKQSILPTTWKGRARS